MIINYIGDSIVLGYGDPAGLGWPGRLSGTLRTGGEDITSYNLGVRRDTTPKIAKRWKREVEPRLIPGVPCKLVFSFGVADQVNKISESETLEAAEAMLTEAKTMGDVLVVGPTPVLDEAMCARVGYLSPAVGGLCRRLGIPFIPMVEALLADPIFPQALADFDNVHPTAPGYAAMARHLLAAPALRAFFEMKED
ncbi:GDSL-type esterase/lipase family protein [Pseudodesulfovibrio sp.]|uniref:GDSL-type esterase/lipase family protein n=1 Tax=unclassified Pseudodesulfovibrio TaxID=2661612 RepID=UPI003B0089D7